jgi:hypothetical protein
MQGAMVPASDERGGSVSYADCDSLLSRDRKGVPMALADVKPALPDHASW